jgi:small subunit ribosomal protein S9
MADEPATPEEPLEESAAAEEQPAGEPAVAEPVAEMPATEEAPAEEPADEAPAVVEPVAEEQPAAEPVADEEAVEELVAEELAVEEAIVEELAVEEAVEELVAEELAVEEAIVEELVEELAVEEAVEELAAEELAVEEAIVEELVVEELVAEASAAESPSEEQPSAEPAAAQEPAAEVEESDEEDFEEEEEEPAPRVKPAVPGAHLEVDIVPEGVDPLAREAPADPYAIEEYAEDVAGAEEEAAEESLPQPISTAAIDLAAGARYRATGKRKTAIARVILRPGSGVYLINGRTLEEHFPRTTLQRNIRQPLETVGYEERMDVIARLHGGGISAQAGALRHGVSRALLEADPNLRGELKRRGFLTRDSRAKERKKAGLKKARKRPQFSKR